MRVRWEEDSVLEAPSVHWVLVPLGSPPALPVLTLVLLREETSERGALQQKSGV